MAEFMRWLQTPHRNVKVSSIKPSQDVLQANTVNAYISSVIEFYDYLMKIDDYSIQLSQRLKSRYQVLGENLRISYIILTRTGITIRKF
ncbi:hypothetical protein TheetDRAFT_2956 [Thermoanaerobacter ethanolicus JW 200]|nr:hypothetical protein TheetDRAFT_2956 [Thermoanaerobacter ethanolicus JW 200]